MSVKEIERPSSLSELATSRLRDAIVSGTYKLGEALSEGKLAESLNISKTPVRHALAQMRVEGLVEVFPQKGTFVFTVSAGDLMELCVHRVILETAAVQLAFDRNRQNLAKQLAASVANMKKALGRSDVRRYLKLDTEFHRIILRQTDNRYLIEGYNLIEAKIAAIRTHLAVRPMQSDQSFAEHEAIAKLLEKGEIAKATRALRHHIERYSRSYDRDTDDIAARDQQQS